MVEVLIAALILLMVLWLSSLSAPLAVHILAGLAALGGIYAVAARRPRSSSMATASASAAQVSCSLAEAEGVRYRLGLGSFWVEFSVGNRRVAAWMSYFSGLEKFFVDGREVLRVRSFAMTCWRRITVDGATGEVVMHFHGRFTTTIDVYHHGRRLYTDLLPSIRLVQWALGVPLGIIVALSSAGVWFGLVVLP